MMYVQIDKNNPIFEVTSSCGFNATATDTPQPFTSPGHPGRYSNSLNCSWNFRSPPGTQIFIEFLAFDLESNFDFVAVRKGKYFTRLLCYNTVTISLFSKKEQVGVAYIPI